MCVVHSFILLHSFTITVLHGTTCTYIQHTVPVVCTCATLLYIHDLKNYRVLLLLLLFKFFLTVPGNARSGVASFCLLVLVWVRFTRRVRNRTTTIGLSGVNVNIVHSLCLSRVPICIRLVRIQCLEHQGGLFAPRTTVANAGGDKRTVC
jgi:hypothetical protein